MILFHEYFYYFNTVLLDIPIWIQKLPAPLRDDNLLSALLGAIVSALIIERTQITKERAKEVNQINTVKVVVIAALENTLELKRQFVIKLVQDLHTVRATHQAAKDPQAAVLKIKGSRYLFQYPVPTYQISKAVALATNMNLRSGRLFRGILRLQESVHILTSTVDDRNRVVSEFKAMIESCSTDIERNKVRLRMYGIPNGDEMLDVTLASLTDALYLYCDDVLKFCEVTLNNIEKYSERFLTKRQRNKLFEFGLIEEIEGMPAPDHLAVVVENLVIPENKLKLKNIKQCFLGFKKSIKLSRAV